MVINVSARFLRRKPNWPQLLDLFLNSRQDSSFVWGVNDCGQFAFDAVVAMTGEDPAAPFRNSYHTERSAARAMLDFAGGGLREAAEKIAADWNMPRRRSLRLAQRGDLVLLPTEVGESLGVVSLNPRFCAGMSPCGFAMAPISVCVAAWKV